MTRHYSIKDFFRQMPNALLARYFQAQSVFDELDFSAMKETAPEALLEAWPNLPDSKRNEMEAEFREVFELSTEKGFQAIVDEADWHLRGEPDGREAFVEKLSSLANHYERAMVTLLDHRAYWKGANRFFHADALPYWRKRKNLPHTAAAVDEASLNELAEQIRGYFHKTEGRGNNGNALGVDQWLEEPDSYGTRPTHGINWGTRRDSPGRTAAGCNLTDTLTILKPSVDSEI